MSFSASGWQWWLVEDSARAPAQLLDDYLQTGHSAGVTLLREKAIKSRRCYRLAPSALPVTPRYFAKQLTLMPRKRLGALLGQSNPLVGYSHGTAELAYNLALWERTPHGVKTFALGEYFRNGLPVQQVLLQEYLEDWQPFNVVWRSHEDNATLHRTLLLKFCDMLVSLRDAGISHLDLHPGNVMVSPDLQAPLRAIDCGQMSLEGDPVISMALHLGVFLHELKGKHHSSSPKLEDAACRMLYGLAGAEAGFPVAERLLALLVRHSTKKPFSRRWLLRQMRRHKPGQLPLHAIEKQLYKLSQRRQRPAHAMNGPGNLQEEQRLIAALHDAMTGRFSDRA
ncbi:hypothetical protein [Stutzerimonas stutzeri]|uniref:hypothetical protein n=1 Tax=Stutzerimonas stutzeri TaxID=316 RepID=UPI00210B1020|nr:hypothetical protein [Stutzerimonas stutzeri]MCQ4318929.1 hypothetical protein [Stutzerimonas stutzeri]